MSVGGFKQNAFTPMALDSPWPQPLQGVCSGYSNCNNLNFVKSMHILVIE